MKPPFTYQQLDKFVPLQGPARSMAYGGNRGEANNDLAVVLYAEDYYRLLEGARRYAKLKETINREDR